MAKYGNGGREVEFRAKALAKRGDSFAGEWRVWSLATHEGVSGYWLIRPPEMPRVEPVFATAREIMVYGVPEDVQ